MKTTVALILFLSAAASFAEDKTVHVFILSGQSNMAGMDPESGFVPEARMLFGRETVAYIKVAKGGQPICRWVSEWAQIAKEKGMDPAHRERILKGKGVLFYQPILDQYRALLEEHPEPKSVTFCWMQGERDANGGADAAYKDSLKLLIANLRRDLKRPDMNVVIGRIGDYALDKPSCVAVRRAQRDVANEDPHGAWVDVDDLNNKQVKGRLQDVVHYTREGYEVLGRRFARQGYALVKGKEPAQDGRPSRTTFESVLFKTGTLAYSDDFDGDYNRHRWGAPGRDKQIKDGTLVVTAKFASKEEAMKALKRDHHLGLEPVVHLNQIPEAFVCRMRYRFETDKLSAGRPVLQIGHHMIAFNYLEGGGHRIKLPDGPSFAEAKSGMKLGEWIDLVIEYRKGEIAIGVNGSSKTYKHEKVTIINTKDKHGPRFTFKGGPNCRIVFDSVRLWNCEE